MTLLQFDNVIAGKQQWCVDNGDCRELLRQIPDESVQCVITSPPYWGLRDYGVSGQLGLEPSPQEYVAQMVDVFREVKRVLRPDGTLWLNMGDSYSSGSRTTQTTPTLRRDGHDEAGGKHKYLNNFVVRPGNGGLDGKQLIGVPWRLAFALQDDGWWLRSDIIWAKPNPMPESVTDRPTKAHEYIFLLTKSAKYYYDADAVRETFSTEPHAPGNKTDNDRLTASMGPFDEPERIWGNTNGRNIRSVWTVATHPFSQAHFATFPPKLIEPCVKAGTSEKGQCPECGAPWVRVNEYGGNNRIKGHARAVAMGHSPNGPTAMNRAGDGRAVTATIWRPSCAHDRAPVPQVILDPFAGAGTTGLVASRMNRRFIGLELNEDYVSMARNRIYNDAPLLQVGSNEQA